MICDICGETVKKAGYHGPFETKENGVIKSESVMICGEDSWLRPKTGCALVIWELGGGIFSPSILNKAITIVNKRKMYI